MVVVSDTSVLLALEFLGRLSLLPRFYTRVLIPPAVRNELRSFHDEHFPGRKDLDEPWLECREPIDRARVALFSQKLDQGEAEALALAGEVKAQLVLMDEKDGRRFARGLGLNVIGVVGILLRAKREGSLPLLRPELDRLREELKFFISDRLYAEALAVSSNAPSIQ